MKRKLVKAVAVALVVVIFASLFAGCASSKPTDGEKAGGKNNTTVETGKGQGEGDTQNAGETDEGSTGGTEAGNGTSTEAGNGTSTEAGNGTGTEGGTGGTEGGQGGTEAGSGTGAEGGTGGSGSTDNPTTPDVGAAKEISMSIANGADHKAVTIGAMPASTAEFAKMAEGKLSTPEYTCTLFLCAINLFAQNADAGTECLNILKGPQPLSNRDIGWYKDRLRDKKYLANVYFDGATPENSYKPSEPLTVKFYPDQRPQDCEEGYMRLTVKAPAFDSPRNFKLRQKDGNWYIWEISSIMTGVRIPANEDPWA